MGQVLEFSVRVESTDCCDCGVTFASSVISERRRDHKLFYCPNGHSMHFTGESDKEKIARLSNERNEARDARNRAQEMLEAKRVQMARLRKRLKNGVCPCCKRTFENLKRHLAAKHPEFK